MAPLWLDRDDFTVLALLRHLCRDAGDTGDRRRDLRGDIHVLHGVRLPRHVHSDGLGEHRAHILDPSPEP